MILLLKQSQKEMCVKKIILATVCLLFVVFTARSKTIELNEDNSLVLNKAFDMESVSKVLSRAFQLSIKNPSQDLYLVLDSPGGSVIAGMNLLEGLKAIPNKVHTITFSAASMGYQTVQNLGTRYITSYGYLMSHRAHISGVSGQIPGELETRIKFYKDLLTNLDIQTASRVGLSLEEYSKLIHDEYWVVGASAVKAGHADELVEVVCSKKLVSMETVETITNMFGSLTVTWSGCPIIRFPLSISRSNGYYGNIDIQGFKNSLLEKGKIKGL